MVNTDWNEYVEAIHQRYLELRRSHPDVLNGYTKMAVSAIEEDELTSKVKELIALGIAIALRCDECLAFHTKEAIATGVTREEFVEMIGVAVYMGGGPSANYGAKALEIFDKLGGKEG